MNVKNEESRSFSATLKKKKNWSRITTITVLLNKKDRKGNGEAGAANQLPMGSGGGVGRGCVRVAFPDW